MSATEGDKGRFLALLAHDIGWDIDRLHRDHHAIPGQITALREKLLPLKVERQRISALYQSKGTQPSLFDLERRFLLSQLKEEARAAHARQEASKGDGEKRKEMTDGRAEDIAHASPNYRKLLDDAKADHRRLAELAQLMGEIYDQIEKLEMRRGVLVQRIEQCRAMTYAWKAELRLT